MIYNFRIDRTSRDEILRRLHGRESFLSMGWGGGENSDLRVDRDDYVAACKNFYKLETTRIATNLTGIRAFKDGDILVVPHLPEDGKVSIHLVEGDFPNCYAYLARDSCHLNNRIRIKCSYGLDGNIDAHNTALINWYGKLRALQYPILPIGQFESDFLDVIDRLNKNSKIEIGPSELQDFLDRLTESLLGRLRDELDHIAASGGETSFERICEHIVKSTGYRIERRNMYDSKGGDVDLRCSRQRSDSSPFEVGQAVLFVQVKKHKGKSDERPVKQLLKMIKQEPTADGCVMSLADDYTDEAKELAEKNGILLLNGSSICQLLLKELAKGAGTA
jgi:hypothetical protein